MRLAIQRQVGHECGSRARHTLRRSLVRAMCQMYAHASSRFEGGREVRYVASVRDLVQGERGGQTPPVFNFCKDPHQHLINGASELIFGLPCNCYIKVPAPT